MCKISVIIPIYNVEEYLNKCLESVRAQTFSDFEVLCVNDGTKDNSQTIVDRYVAMDKRFVSLIKENGGLSDARNYGIPYAKGDYVFFLDADDSIKPDCLEKLYARVLETGSDLVMCGYNETSYTGELKNCVVDKNCQVVPGLDYVLEKLPHCAWNKLYHISFFKETGIRFPKGLYYEDIGTSPLVYLKARKMTYVAEPLLDYLVDRPGNITTSVNKKIIDVVEDLKIVNEFYIANGAFESNLDLLCRFNIAMIFDNLYKCRTVSDKSFVSSFFDSAYGLLDYYFPEWKRNEFMKKYGIKRFMLTNKNLYQTYLNRGKR